MQQKISFKTILMVFTACITWFAVILQFSISINLYLQSGRTLGGTIVQLFSFFTILSNILIAVYLSVLLLKPASRPGKYFSSASVAGAVAVYIAIVGLVYNLVLRYIWAPAGLSRVADELLHLVNPVLFLLYWLIYAPKSTLKWGDLYYWLIFPLIYLIFIIIRGAVSGFYPYPFMDVLTLGYAKVAVNSLMIMAGFVFFSALFIFIGRFQAKKT